MYISMSGKRINIGKKPGIERRPVEYMLVALLIGLIMLLVWSVSSLNEQGVIADSRSSNKTLKGGLEEISWLTEEEILTEEKIDASHDRVVQKALEAADSVTSSANKELEAISNLSCDDLSQAKQKLTTQLVDKSKELEVLQSDKLKLISQSGEKRNKSIIKVNQKYDDRLSESYRLLVDKRQAETEKAKEYSGHVDSVVSARRQSYQDARLSYTDSVERFAFVLYSSRTDALNGLKSSVEAMFTEAENSCKTQPGSGDTRSLKDRLNSAGDDIADRAKEKSDFKQLIDTRRQAYKAARSSFETSLINIKSGYANL